MNRFVEAWDRHEKRRKPDNGIDSVKIDGENFKIKGIVEMAERKSPQVEPVKDNSAGNQPINRPKRMEKAQFNNVIRLIKRSSIDRAAALMTATWKNLKRLGVKRDLTKAVSGIPNGSDHGDIGTLVTWCDSITPTDKRAIRQLVALDATCTVRVKG